MNKKQLISALIICLIFFCSNGSLAQPNLEISGIFYDKNGNSTAIVNEGVVKVGSNIDGTEVTQINEDSVKFKYKDEIIILKIGEELSTTTTLAYFELGKTTLDKIMVGLKNKNKEYALETGGLQFTIMHKYQDYLDAPYTITLAFKDMLYGNPAQFKLFFTPKSKMLYRVEICTDGDKDKFLRFFIGKYNKQPNYTNACYSWPSKPDPATNEVFYNILFCPDGAYSPKITLFWTDWDYLYVLAVMEGTEIRAEELKKTKMERRY